MKFVIPIKAVVECKTDAAAESAANEINALLKMPAVKALLAARGVTVVGHTVDKPVRSP